MITISIVACLIIVFVQDLNERSVYWFLFPLIGLLGSTLLFQNLEPAIYLPTIAVNLAFVLLLLVIVYLYARFKLKLKFFSAIALGDVLMFLVLAISFSTMAFIVLFIFAMIFSLILHLLITKKSKFDTVPLAGNMSLFFGIVYLLDWMDFTNYLYI